MAKIGYKQSKKHIAKRVTKQLGQKRTKEQRERMSLAAKRYFKKHDNYWKDKKRDDPDYIKRQSEAHKGQHSSPATEFKKGINNGYTILGGKTKYRNLHYWVEKKLGKPTKCEHCGKDGLSGQKIHWANKSGKYEKNINDWIRLCAKCHFCKDKRSDFDFINGK